MGNFYSQEVQNFLQKLVAYCNVLVIYHPSTPDNKRYYVVNTFTQAQHQIYDHTLSGKDITSLVNSIGNNFISPISINTKSPIETQLDEIIEQKMKFSRDYSYEWWLG